MTATEGDTELAEAVRRLLGRRHSVVGAAAVTPGGVSRSTIGAPLEADFEIGSVSKGVTGLLYVDAVSRGELAPTTTLGELLPLGPCPASSVTVASLSTHRSGLPRLPRTRQPFRRTLALWRHGTNPYGETLDELLEQTRRVSVGRPRPRYSNLGFELLGHAVARSAGVTYAELVRSRLAAPLHLHGVHVPAGAEELRATSLVGRAARSGRVQEPWTGVALGPAGGIRATAEDMGRLLVALRDGTAPGAAALDPVAPFSGRAVRIGAAWITIPVRGRHVTWHNGGTGGFRSWAGLDRAAGTGVALMSASSSSVDRAGFTLLQELS